MATAVAGESAGAEHPVRTVSESDGSDPIHSALEVRPVVAAARHALHRPINQRTVFTHQFKTTTISNQIHLNNHFFYDKKKTKKNIPVRC